LVAELTPLEWAKANLQPRSDLACQQRERTVNEGQIGALRTSVRIWTRPRRVPERSRPFWGKGLWPLGLSRHSRLRQWRPREIV